MTPSHFLPIYSTECGEKFCQFAKLVPAASVKPGDFLYTQDGFEMVKDVSSSRSFVRYLLVEGGNLIVNGVLASVQSTAAGALETLPFRFLDTIFPGSLEVRPDNIVVCLPDPSFRPRLSSRPFAPS